MNGLVNTKRKAENRVASKRHSRTQIFHIYKGKTIAMANKKQVQRMRNKSRWEYSFNKVCELAFIMSEVEIISTKIHAIVKLCTSTSFPFDITKWFFHPVWFFPSPSISHSLLPRATLHHLCFCFCFSLSTHRNGVASSFCCLASIFGHAEVSINGIYGILVCLIENMKNPGAPLL